MIKRDKPAEEAAAEDLIIFLIAVTKAMASTTQHK
jgi:hypothetical protein